MTYREGPALHSEPLVCKSGRRVTRFRENRLGSAGARNPHEVSCLEREDAWRCGMTSSVSVFRHDSDMPIDNRAGQQTSASGTGLNHCRIPD